MGKQKHLVAALFLVAVMVSSCGVKMLGPRDESRFDPKYQEEVIFTWKKSPGNRYNIVVIDPTEKAFMYEAGEVSTYSLAIGKMKPGIYRWYVEKISIETGKTGRSAERRFDIR